jgi:hypothetical protein
MLSVKLKNSMLSSIEFSLDLGDTCFLPSDKLFLDNSGPGFESNSIEANLGRGIEVVKSQSSGRYTQV